MHSVKYVFTDTTETWQQMLWDTMTAEDQTEATQAWQKAEFAPGSASVEETDEAEVLAAEEDVEIGKAMAAFIRKDLKWTHRELHDALLTAGVSVPSVPSLRNYIAALHAQYGDADTGFLPQSFHSHTKKKIQEILRILGRTGTKLGGTLSDSKGVLAQRLAHWLNRVLAAGRAKPGSASEEDLDDEECIHDSSRKQKQTLVDPSGVELTAEQAESALGCTMATELDGGCKASGKRMAGGEAALTTPPKVAKVAVMPSPPEPCIETGSHGARVSKRSAASSGVSSGGVGDSKRVRRDSDHCKWCRLAFGCPNPIAAARDNGGPATLERRTSGAFECKICANIMELRRLTTEQRKQLLELLESQDQQALEDTEGYRQKYIKTANENGGGRVHRHDIGLGQKVVVAGYVVGVQGGVRSTRLQGSSQRNAVWFHLTAH